MAVLPPMDLSSLGDEMVAIANGDMPAIHRFTSAEAAQLENDLIGLVQVEDIEEPSYPGALSSGFGSADRQLELSELRIRIARHTIHREDNQGTDQSVFVVSKDRWYFIDLQLTDLVGRLAAQNTLKVSADIVFENGQEVPVAGPHDQRLVGPQETTIINGLGTFKLKMGPSILSQRHGEQKFRVRICPSDVMVSQANPALTIHSAPMKSVTKLFRKKPEAAATSSNNDAPGEATSPGEGRLIATLQKRLELERAEREQLESKVGDLENEVASERSRREKVEREQAQQRQILEDLLKKVATLSCSSSAGAAASRPAAIELLPPHMPLGSGPKRAPLPPQAARSRSPRHQKLEEEGSSPERLSIHRGKSDR